MNYLEQLTQLDALGEQFAQRASRDHKMHGWRLFVRPSAGSDTSCVELQRIVGDSDSPSWFTVGSVACSTRSGVSAGRIGLKTYITCTICGTWPEEEAKTRGLEWLTNVATAFHTVTHWQEYDT